MTKNYRPTDPLRQTATRLHEASASRGRSGFHFPINIYVYLDAAGEPLYVGQSWDLRTRHGAHRQKSAWFWDATELRVLARTYERSEARRLEAKAIRKLRPRHNVHHNVMPRASAGRGYNINEQVAS